MNLVRVPPELDNEATFAASLLVAIEGPNAKVYCGLICPDEAWSGPPLESGLYTQWEAPQEFSRYVNPSRLFTSNVGEGHIFRPYKTYHSTEFPREAVWSVMTPTIAFQLAKRWFLDAVDSHQRTMAEHMLAESEARWGSDCGVTPSTPFFADRYNRELVI